MSEMHDSESLSLSNLVCCHRPTKRSRVSITEKQLSDVWLGKFQLVLWRSVPHPVFDLVDVGHLPDWRLVYNWIWCKFYFIVYFLDRNVTQQPDDVFMLNARALWTCVTVVLCFGHCIQYTYSIQVVCHTPPKNTHRWCTIVVAR